MRDVTYPPVIRTALGLFKLLDLQLQTAGTHHIPAQGGAILAANHIGYVDFIFDGFAAWEPHRRLVRFMAKKEAYKNPLVRGLMNSFHHIAVDRDNGAQAFNKAVEMARSGEIIGVFPEATISRSMDIKELKTGAVRMAAAAGVPLIPMVSWGTQLLMTKDHPKDLWTRHRTVGLQVGEPLQVTGEDPVAETQALREAMIGLLDAAIAEYPVSPEGQWWAPARHGGIAPTPKEAAKLDAEERQARAERRAARGE